MRFQATDVVRSTPEQAFAWWTDVGEGDAGAIMPPLRRRRVLRRSPSEVETEDRWSVYGIPLRTRAVLRPMPPDRWEVTSYFRGGTYRDTVHIEPVPGGTRVAMEMDLGGLRWPWSWAVGLLRNPLGRLLQRDLEAVNRRLEESLAAPPPSPRIGEAPGP